MQQAFESEIVRKCGVISQKGNVTKELNVVRFGNHPLKYDLRSWETTQEKGHTMRKGITFDEEEIVLLRDLLNELDLDEPLEPQGFTDGGFTSPRFSSKPFPGEPGYIF